MRDIVEPWSGGYLRFPSLSGNTVVFCCEDDLWVVSADGGAAHRLTAGVSEASHPRLSPDGGTVAFVAAGDGPAEVYAMPLSGGPVRRLTYQAARCAVVGWHPRTQEIIYASTAEQPTGFGHRLFAVSAEGGPARLLEYGPARSVSHGPGAGMVLGRSIAEPARWKRYRGGAAGRLWIDPVGAGDFAPLISLPGNLADPCWVGDRIYFLSDHEGVGNVYSCHPDGSGLARHTQHTDFYARNLATDGRRLVYHAAAEIFLLDPAEGGSRRIPVTLMSDRALRARRFVSAADHLDGARLSPDGTTLALVARGKAFTLNHWSGPVRRHGEPDGVRYRLPDWLGDGRRLVAIAADERPDERLALLAPEGTPAGTELPLGDVGHVAELAAAPVGALVAFATNRQQLWTVDVDAADPAPRLIDASEHERIEDLAWSPDGRWLAYTHPDSPRTSAVKVAEAESGRVHRVTRPVLRDAMPVFDPSGRYLYFISQRDLTPELDQVKFDVGFPFGARPYLAVLRAGDPAPFRGAQLPPGLVPDDADDTLAPGPHGPPVVDIDFAGIEQRIAPFPVAEGRFAGIVPLPDSVLLLTVPVAAPDPAKTHGEPEGSVASVDLATGEVTGDYLTPVDEISVSRDNSVLLYRWNDRLRVLSADVDRDAAGEHLHRCAPTNRHTGWIDLDRVMLPTDPGAEWRQMFREAWRLQRESFWSAGMAGVDWDAVYERYLPLAARVASRAELSDLLWELQGELGSSHAYESGGDYRRPEELKQGFLGVDWDVTPPLGEGSPWRIRRILLGDPWSKESASPCARPGTDIRPGDTLTAVNGVPVGSLGPGELLVGQAGRDVELTLRRDGSAPRRTVVRALGTEARARYRDWVENQRTYVHTTSRERLGYIHVPDMSSAGYAEFVRGFLAELDREGLVIDVRYNSGGHVSPLLIDRLARRRAGAEHGRWSGRAPYPAEAPRGPMAALVNEHTGSDGEIFSHLFRARGCGPLIGTRTWGGVIATWPRHRLVDGTVTTQPEFRYFLTGVGDGLENRGVEPDIVVESKPAHHDGDVQLETAVRYLLSNLSEPAGAHAQAGEELPSLAAAARWDATCLH